MLAVKDIYETSEKLQCSYKFIEPLLKWALTILCAQPLCTHSQGRTAEGRAAHTCNDVEYSIFVPP